MSDAMTELPDLQWWGVPKGTTLTIRHPHTLEERVVEVFQLMRAGEGLEVEDVNGDSWRFRRAVLSAKSLERIGPPPWDRPIVFEVECLANDFEPVRVSNERANKRRKGRAP